jgi:hypothetical protein
MKAWRSPSSVSLAARVSDARGKTPLYLAERFNEGSVALSFQEKRYQLS